jgi:tetratricopeptide (TPR) repeat protein
MMKKICTSLLLSQFLLISIFAQTSAKDWYDKGIALKTKENYKDAAEAFKKAVSIQENYPEALHQQGYCYNELGLYDDAIEVLRKEEKLNPTARNQFELGYAMASLKKYDEALTYFDRAIELSDDYGEAYKQRGNTYFRQKNYEKALEDYKQYEELEEEIADSKFYFNKGWVENDLGKYEDAIKTLDRCVELDIGGSEGFVELAYSHYKLKQNDDAIRNYRKAINNSKEPNRLATVGMGDVYFDNMENYDSALVYYEKASRLKKDGKVYYRLGWCYNDKERYSDAVQALKQAIEIDSSLVKAQTELGYAYYKLKLYEDALAQFSPVMIRDPKSELSRYYAGLCYNQRGEKENLKKMIDELTGLNSKYAETLTKLNQ